MRALPPDPLCRPLAFPVLPRFSAYKSANQTGITGSPTKITLAGQAYLPYGCYLDTANHRYYILRGGVWEISVIAGVSPNNNAESGYLYIYKNGSSVGVTGAATRSTIAVPGCGVTDDVTLSPGDYIEAYCSFSGPSGNAIYALASTYNPDFRFTGRLVAEA